MAKTVKVEALIERANCYFRNSENDKREARRALQSFVEGFLHDAKRYRGFRYLAKEEMKPGLTHGVEHGPDGPTFPDDSRVSMF